MNRLLAATELDVIREPGFSAWVVYLIVFLMVVDRLKSWFVPASRKISGSIETRSEREHADKAETEKRLDEIEEDLSELRQSNTQQHAEASRAGLARVESITKHIDTLFARHEEKHDELTSRINKFIELASRHDAVIPQLDERLTQLSTETHASVQRLHSRIDDTIRAHKAR